MKKIFMFFILCIGLFGLLPGWTSSSAAARSLSADLTTASVIAKYRELIPQEMSRRRIPGMAIAIVDNNQVVWAEGFGFTDTDRKVPVTADTPFSIQSMTKSFTAALVMIAVQEGWVDLDTPISAYLPGYHINSIFEEHPEDLITLRHLLSHTAGFTHDAPIGNNNNLETGTWEEHIASISKTWLLFPVGRRYNYSNNGIDLAAHIVETQAGIPFPQLVKTRILDPLGMSHSTLDINSIRAMPDRAVGHSVFSRQIPISPIMAAGGLYTSASDMAKYLQFFLNLGKVRSGTGESIEVLRPDLIEEMYNGQFPASVAQGYGLGLGYFRANDATNTLQIGHGGGGFGFISDMAWFPQLNFGVVWLTNSSDHDLQSWLTGQIIGDYIDANRSTMASRANQSQSFDPKALAPQAPAVLSDVVLAKLIASRALPSNPEILARRRALTGYYGLEAWGRTGEIHRVSLKNGSLTLDGAGLTEAQPGLFFTDSGEALDLRGPENYLKNIALTKIGQGTVLFYEVFLGLCGIGCLALLLWAPARWIWGRVRRRKFASNPGWASRIAGIWIFLGALVGIVMLVVIWKFPALLFWRSIVLPTASLAPYENIALNSPYILLGLSLIAAVFSGIGWKGKSTADRWVEAGKIGLLLVYSLVVI